MSKEGRPTFSLGKAMIAVVAVALGIAATAGAYRDGIPRNGRGLENPANIRALWWSHVDAEMSFAVASGVVVWAVGAASLVAGRGRWFWAGVAVIVVGGVLLGFGQTWAKVHWPLAPTRLWPPYGPRSNDIILFGPIYFASTAHGIGPIDPASGMPPAARVWVVPQQAIQTAVPLLSLGFGWLGGLLCRRIARDRPGRPESSGER